MRIRDPGWKKFGYGTRDLGWKKNWIQDSGFGMEKFESGIRDKHPGSAKVETSSPNLQGLKEPNNNQTLCGKGILG